VKSFRIVTIFVCLLSISSCKALVDWLHDGDIIARVGQTKLYFSEIEPLMPSGLSEEDSLQMLNQFILSWASEQLYADAAERELSKADRDVSKEIEAYKNSLLKYRYEQIYVNTHLDTLVSQSDIEKYYREHPEQFTLSFPIFKARFLDIMRDSPNIETLRARMSSRNTDDLAQADSLAYSSALKYADYSSKWIPASVLAQDFGTDIKTMVSNWSGDYIEISDEMGDIKVAYVIDSKRQGSVAPLDYCKDRIVDIIISSRKYSIITNLEQELLDHARSGKDFVVYTDKKENEKKH